MVYKWYILPIGGLYATYHLLGEPKTTIDLNVFKDICKDQCRMSSECQGHRQVIFCRVLRAVDFGSPESWRFEED